MENLRWGGGLLNNYEQFGKPLYIYVGNRDNIRLDQKKKKNTRNKISSNT